MMDKIKVFGIVDCSQGIEGIFKSLEIIETSARLRGENVENICTTVFHINESDSPEEEIRLYDDGRNSYLIAINRQVREDYEEAKEIYRQLSKIIDRDPSHKKGWLSLALLRE